MMQDLFTPLEPCREIAPGAFLLKNFVQNDYDLLNDIASIAQQSPFRHMVTSRGFRMSVSMTNCGNLGWVSDQKGYRYTKIDPDTSRAWPAMPPSFLNLAQSAARMSGYAHFLPDACLINRYVTGAKMSLHQDKDEKNMAAPIVSVSLGLPVTFLFGGTEREHRKQKIVLEHGDVVVWGGASRLAYHGILPLKDGLHPLLGNHRINLTFRQVL